MYFSIAYPNLCEATAHSASGLVQQTVYAYRKQSLQASAFKIVTTFLHLTLQITHMAIDPEDPTLLYTNVL